MKKFLLTLYNVLGFTGLWLAPIVYVILCQGFPDLDNQKRLFVCLAVIVWTSFNNFWSVACEGKRFDEIGIGDGLIPDTGLKKESPQKRMAMYPKVPSHYLSKEPDGIILGTYKNRYVRIPYNG